MKNKFNQTMSYEDLEAKIAELANMLFLAERELNSMDKKNYQLNQKIHSVSESLRMIASGTVDSYETANHALLQLEDRE